MRTNDKNNEVNQYRYTPDLPFRGNTFVLGTYQDFIKQEAQYFLQKFSVPRDVSTHWGVPSPRELMSQGSRPDNRPSTLSYLVANSLNNKTNPSFVINSSVPFEKGAEYYFYHDQYSEINRDVEMVERFQSVAIQTMNKLDFGGMNGVQDFMPKNSIGQSHMTGRIHRDMNNEIGRLTNNVAFQYLMENPSAVNAHTAKDVENIVNREIVVPFEKGIAHQRELSAKVLGLMDIKESVLKDYSKPDFLGRYGRAIDMDAFNADANLNHIYQEATNLSIAIPDSFYDLQAGLNDLGKQGVQFEGVDAIQFPTNHRELSSLLHREGVDINNSELKACAHDYKSTLEFLGRTNPFTNLESEIASAKPSENLAELLKQMDDPSPSL